MIAQAPRLSASEHRAWKIVSMVPDPEIPTVSIVELGIVRAVHIEANPANVVSVTITPTYSGCPAMDAIRDDIVAAFRAEGMVATVAHQLSPAWTTDWILPSALPKFRALGIAPPQPAAAPSRVNVIGLVRRDVSSIRCPLCDSPDVEQLSHFSATACKALYRCVACREPFDYFKPI